MFNLLTGTPSVPQADIVNIINKPAVVQRIEEKEPTLDQKIKTNYYKCNTDVEWIRADNAKCLPKRTAPVQKAVKTAVRASGGYNDMDYGYCTWFVKNLRPDLPAGLGNANTWYSRAQAFGLSVGSVPQVGAVATTTRGDYGHVSYVTGVEGNLIHVIEMNVAGWNVQSNGTYPAGDYLYIYE